MLLVPNLANTKSGKKPDKLLKPWHMGTHMIVLSEGLPTRHGLDICQIFYDIVPRTKK